MIRIDRQRAAGDLLPAINRVFELSAQKIRSIEDTWRPEDGSPVFTVDGIYKSRGWTEWTQGFQFGAPLLQFDATGDREFLELGRSRTLERMAPHLTHVGVHDHGFNNVSTYGNLWRLAREGKFDAEPWELRFYALALRVTGAVQARRWTPIPGGGFIYSFNGAHSLFVDTMRTLRALALSHVLGHRLFEEQDVQVNLARAPAAACARHGRVTASTTATGATRTMSAAARRTRVCSMRPTARIADRARSKAIRRSPRGRAASPGRCWASRSSSSFSRRFDPTGARRATEREHEPNRNA